MTTSTTTETSTTFINQKLQFVEELVLHTSAHIFLTGRAGTGKTTFLKSLPAKTYKRMVVVAPTGVAAINAGGQTIHSFFQLPLGPQLPEDAGGSKMQFQKLRREKLKIMRTLDLLIIDEISMVRADVLDAIDAVLRRARRNAKPFGGVQVLMIGDVHQLAPVAKPEEWEVLSPYYRTVYFFGSRVLQQTDYLCVELDHIYRQHDSDFITLLNKVRDNQMDAETIRLLNSRYDPDFKDTDGYITLTTHNAQADEINESHLAAIKKRPFTFTAEVTGIFPSAVYPTKEELELKIGAQVMFIKNDPSPEKAYYNGKIGKITDYDEDNKTVEVTCGNERISVPMITWPNFEYTLNEETQKIEEKEIGQFTQIPLRLAWAVTIHKSQGLTFDKLIVDAHQAFAHGQVYVALSRCTSLEGLVLKTRLSADTLVSDYMVNTFLSQMPGKEPSKEKVETLRQAFELETLLEAVDFLEIFRNIGRIIQIVHANIPLFDAPTIQEISKRYDLVRQEVTDVAMKFGTQIRQLHAQAFYDENPLLQERMKKAAVYFREHISQHFDAIIKLTFKTDNKAVNDLLKDYLNQLQETVTVKVGCLEGFEKGLPLSEYYKIKASKLLDVEKQNRPNKLRDYSSRKDLYGILRAWRDETAEEADVELYAVIPNKTLKAIAEAKPLTKTELRKVEGMGPKRMSAFGEELLAIVRKYVGSDTVYDDSEPEPAPKPVKKRGGDTFKITQDMYESGMNAEEIAAERHLATSTIYGHFARFVANGDYPATKFVDREKCNLIKEYFTEVDDTSLTEARNVLGDDFEYWELRIVLAEWERENNRRSSQGFMK
ncbi:MAG: helix-turn-helix domain-containing protein [Bacteroidales bacterium]|nr:helix-turn-helix domain-containing protein [Bacteroidales bacterium]